MQYTTRKGVNEGLFYRKKKKLRNSLEASKLSSNHSIGCCFVVLVVVVVVVAPAVVANAYS